jgi:hypothetical protein
VEFCARSREKLKAFIRKPERADAFDVAGLCPGAPDQREISAWRSAA